MATAGTPCFDLRENRRNSGMSSPMVMVTRGPIHVMALIEDTSPRQISAPTMRPPSSPNTCLPAMMATSSWPANSRIGVVMQKDGVEGDIEDDDDRGAEKQRAR